MGSGWWTGETSRELKEGFADLEEAADEVTTGLKTNIDSVSDDVQILRDQLESERNHRQLANLWDEYDRQHDAMVMALDSDKRSKSINSVAYATQYLSNSRIMDEIKRAEALI